MVGTQPAKRRPAFGLPWGTNERPAIPASTAQARLAPSRYREAISDLREHDPSLGAAGDEPQNRPVACSALPAHCLALGSPRSSVLSRYPAMGLPQGHGGIWAFRTAETRI